MKTAKLFTNGRSQAVRLPKEYRFEGTEVAIRREGRSIVLTPIQVGWHAMEQSLEEFTSDFMENREQPELRDRAEMFQ